MNKNNKGITLVEMIVSLALVSMVMIFLVKILLSLKDLDEKSLKTIEYEEKSALITKSIQDKIKDQKGCDLKKNGNNLEITCPDITLLLSLNNKTFYLKRINDNTELNSWAFPDEATISNLSCSGSDAIILCKYDIHDEKGNNYPLEISHIKQ